ncbi:MARVEL domain-containing protein 3 [Genypterus blacodes]|uniref:MARVEL domain-containing protein 3 n=1 Tax=Genypterus blacodes TaxID=154954 RepID=UPI003F7659B1
MMSDRGNHHPMREKYPEHKSREREREASHNAVNAAGRRDRDVHRSHGQQDGRGAAGDRRAKQNREREETPPPHRDHYHQGPSGPSREPSMYPSEYGSYEQQHRRPLYNFRYVLTARGLCQVMEVFVNLLIIICAGVPYSNNGGYRDLASLGGLYYYHFGGANAFTGADADRVKELDQLFNQLKRPPYIFTMACGGAVMSYACAMLALGVFRVPYRWPLVLLAEALVNFLIGLGYIPALAFYFIKLKETYNNPICKEREQLYKSKGHQGFGCQLNGADIAGGLFGVLGVFAFMFGAALAVRAFRQVRELKKERTNEDGNL